MHHEKDEVGSKAGLLSRRRTCTVIDRAGAIYGSRQIAKRTGTGRTWLSMLCALRPSVAPLSLSLCLRLCLSSLQSTLLHVTLALITKIFEGPYLLPFLSFFFFSLKRKRYEGIRVGKRIARWKKEGGNVQKLLRVADYRKTIWKII